MTRYLSGQPFSGAVSNGHLTDLQYDIKVGNLVFCPICAEYVKPEELELCPMRRIAKVEGEP